ncbi:hypothetical protein [Elizabethkingia miricola]|uniref:hypothetical protein n=1 Tax=Elizabethkingia miricola TaxID=172045 RepID=UPI0021A912F3|nr:hypothetical protein [Elizabethkingia miricola]
MVATIMLLPFLFISVVKMEIISLFCNVTMAKTLQRNTLLRYKLIKDLYLEHKTEDIPDTKVLRRHIYPKYPISRSTLNTILSTPIEKQLAEINANNCGAQ